MIRVDHLSKMYMNVGFSQKGTRALQDVSLEIKKGEIFAILGLNGAGKTTFIKILLGLVKPTSGMAYLFDQPVTNCLWKNRIGYLPEVFRASQHFTGMDVLQFLGASSGLAGIRLQERIDYVLQLVDLHEAASRKAKSYSKGMTVRLGIAQAILHQPDILILDEPTDGLDPLGKVMIRKLLTELAKNGITIIINSHLLSEVECIAHRVAILHKGRLIREGSLNEIIPSESKYRIEFSEPVSLPQPWICLPSGTSWICEIASNADLQEFLGFVGKNGIQSYTINQIRPTLEEVFLNYIKVS